MSVETQEPQTETPAVAGSIPWLVIGICVLLGGMTFALYSRTLSHDFINFDDNAYVTHNPNVQAGIDVKWAMTAFVAANWHPLTILSHMLDCEIYGLKPWGHHLTNILLHTANVIVLFLVMWQMTGRIWPSCLVAALFSVHPLRVESVAWVAERKDVLSTFFWFVSMGVYAGWVRRRTVGLYFLLLVTFALGLMAKPMLVTLPCALLLLDYWPLGRLSASGWTTGENWRISRQLITEKLPLFALGVLVSMITMYAQRQGGSVISLQASPMRMRLMNVVQCYAEYLGKFIWPRGLAILYPAANRTFGLVEVVGATLGVVGVTWLAVYWGRKRPYITVGWLWYIGTLVPVIGLVQIGAHSLADRYTYVPLVGVFMIIAWTLADFSALSTPRKVFVVLASIAALAVFSAVTWRQLDYWRDTITVFKRALNVTEKNWVAHEALAIAYLDEYQAVKETPGKVPDPKLLEHALAEADTACDLRPQMGRVHFNRARVLIAMERYDDAIEALREAIRKKHRSQTAHSNLGVCLLNTDQVEEALKEFKLAADADPTMLNAQIGIAKALTRLGRIPEAITQLNSILATYPGLPDAANQLARIYATHPDAEYRNADEAVRLAQAACGKTGLTDPYMLDTLAAAYANQGKFDTAISVAVNALRQTRELEQRFPETADLARQIERRVDLYQRGQAYREDPTSISLKGSRRSTQGARRSSEYLHR